MAMTSHTQWTHFGHFPRNRTFGSFKPNSWSRIKLHWKMSRLFRQLNLSETQEQQFGQFRHSWSQFRQHMTQLQTCIFQDVAFNLGSPSGSHVLTGRMLETVSQNMRQKLDDPVHQMDALFMQLDRRQRDILQQLLNEWDH